MLRTRSAAGSGRHASSSRDTAASVRREASQRGKPDGEVGLSACAGGRRRPGSTSAATAASASARDARGHEGYSTNVVSHGSRLEEAPYLELDFYYSRTIGDDPDKRWRMVLTPAFAGGDLFHYSGDFTSHLAIRNAYAETQNLGLHGPAAVGRLAHVPRRRHLSVRLLAARQPEHRRRGRVVSAHRSSRSRCTRAQPPRRSLSVRDARHAAARARAGRDRRPCSTGRASSPSLKLTQQFGNFPRRQDLALRRAAPVAVGRAHRSDRPSPRRALPTDNGWVVGLQLGGWLRPYVFANLWLRVAGGLAAYGELTRADQPRPDPQGRRARARSWARSRPTGSRSGSA